MVSTPAQSGTRPPTSGRGRRVHRPRPRLAALAGVFAVGAATAWWASRPSVGDVARSTAHSVAPATQSETANPTPSPALPPQLAVNASSALPLRVRVLALEQNRHGRWLARVQTGDGPPRLTQAGDVIAQGLRVERIEPGHVTLRRGLQLEMLVAPMPAAALPKPIEPLPTPAPAVIVSAPGHEPPRSSAVDRAILRAKPGGTDRSDWLAAHSTGH